MTTASGSGMFIRVEVDESVASDAVAAKQLAGISVAEEIADIPGIVKQRLSEVKA